MRNGASSRRRRSAHRPQASGRMKRPPISTAMRPSSSTQVASLEPTTVPTARPEVAGDGRLVADGELLVVGGDPQGVAAGGRERRCRTPPCRAPATVPAPADRQRPSLHRRATERSPGRTHQATAGATASSRPSTRVRVATPASAPEATSHQVGARRAHRSDGAPDGARPGRAEHGDVVDLRIQDQERPGEEREHARRPGHPPRAPQLPAHEGR